MEHLLIAAVGRNTGCVRAWGGDNPLKAFFDDYIRKPFCHGQVHSSLYKDLHCLAAIRGSVASQRPVWGVVQRC